MMASRIFQIAWQHCGQGHGVVAVATVLPISDLHRGETDAGGGSARVSQTSSQLLQLMA